MNHTDLLPEPSLGDSNVNKENVSTNLCEDIIRQCEFYFSDSNILKDPFLLKHVKSSNDGWVDLAVVENFSKMRSLTKSHEKVLEALSTSQVLELSEDGKCVRRRNPLPKWDKSVYNRTMIISDFQEGVKITLKSVTDVFKTHSLPPVLVRIWSPGKKIPSDLKQTKILHPQLGTKLSVIIEFSDPESASQAIIVAQSIWNQVYAHLLSDGFNKSKAIHKKTVEKTTAEAIKLFPLKRRVLDTLSQQIRIIHIREPTGPPTENSAGFVKGWRNVLRSKQIDTTVVV